MDFPSLKVCLLYSGRDSTVTMGKVVVNGILLWIKTLHVCNTGQSNILHLSGIIFQFGSPGNNHCLLTWEKSVKRVENER